jgi:hypothetical protein
VPHSKRHGGQGQEGQQQGDRFWDGIESHIVATASGIGNVQIFATEVTHQIAFAKSVVLTDKRATDAKEVERHSFLELKIVNQQNVQRTGQFDITRHIDPVEFGQRFIATTVKQATQFDLRRTGGLVRITRNWPSPKLCTSLNERI